jgi:hypothetical protein
MSEEGGDPESPVMERSISREPERAGGSDDGEAPAVAAAAPEAAPEDAKEANGDGGDRRGGAESPERRPRGGEDGRRARSPADRGNRDRRSPNRGRRSPERRRRSPDRRRSPPRRRERSRELSRDRGDRYGRRDDRDRDRDRDRGRGGYDRDRERDKDRGGRDDRDRDRDRRGGGANGGYQRTEAGTIPP